MTDLTIPARTWAASVDGQWIDTGEPNLGRPGTDAGPQCVDLAKHGAINRGARDQAYGHAADFAKNLAAWSAAFDPVPVPADPREVELWPFDIVSLVGGPFDHWAGHVVVAQSDQGDLFEATQQNPRPAHTTRGLPKRYVVGVARPKGSTAPAQDVPRYRIRWTIANTFEGPTTSSRRLNERHLQRGLVLIGTGEEKNGWLRVSTPWMAAQSPRRYGWIWGEAVERA